ncbi:MAG: NAD-dependent epimerase/dehydratase family protein [Magnetococcales bacterium]|nr:NAD-dependent epimerase/dehydratase family protein [Magnetococcales bacterium]
MNTSLAGKRILVTGGAGFIGTNTTLALLERGAEVTATLHERPPMVQDERITYIRGVDLRDPTQCNRVVEGMEMVVMAAAVTSGAGMIQSRPLIHLTPNVVMNSQMLEAAHASGVGKFLFISSNVVYPVSDQPMCEEDAGYDFFEKYHVAAWMKRFTETICEMYANRVDPSMEVTIVRPGNAYGEFDDFEWETSHVIPALIRKSVERHDPLEVWGDGKDIKDMIHVSDLADGICRALESCRGFEIVNIASGQPVSIREILSTILDVDGYRDAKIITNPTKPSMIPKRLIAVDKARELLGFQAKTSLEEGLRRTIQWYRNNRAA